jgi:hypothetical protein
VSLAALPQAKACVILTDVRRLAQPIGDVVQLV